MVVFLLVIGALIGFGVSNRWQGAALGAIITVIGAPLLLIWRVYAVMDAKETCAAQGTNLAVGLSLDCEKPDYSNVIRLNELQFTDMKTNWNEETTLGVGAVLMGTIANNSKVKLEEVTFELSLMDGTQRVRRFTERICILCQDDDDFAGVDPGEAATFATDAYIFSNLPAINSPWVSWKVIAINNYRLPVTK